MAQKTKFINFICYFYSEYILSLPPSSLPSSTLKKSKLLFINMFVGYST